eukprot:gene10297-biopygen12299
MSTKLVYIATKLVHLATKNGRAGGRAGGRGCGVLGKALSSLASLARRAMARAGRADVWAGGVVECGVKRSRRSLRSLVERWPGPGGGAEVPLTISNSSWRCDVDRGAGVARAYMARAWRGLQAIFPLGGAGVARAWRGRGAGMSCNPWPQDPGFFRVFHLFWDHSELGKVIPFAPKIFLYRCRLDDDLFWCAWVRSNPPLANPHCFAAPLRSRLTIHIVALKLTLRDSCYATASGGLGSLVQRG